MHTFVSRRSTLAAWEPRRLGFGKASNVISREMGEEVRSRDTLLRNGSTMMLLVRLKGYCIAHGFRRMLCRVSAPALFVWCILPQCIASNFRTWTISGVYLTRDGQLDVDLRQRNHGTYWIDGYRMSVTKQTQICWHRTVLQFGSVLGRDAQPIPQVDASSPCEIAPPSAFGERLWLQYTGVQKYLDAFKPEMKVVATRIDVWNSDNNEKHRFVPHTTATPTWQALCASTSPHQLLYPNEGPIDVVCDAKVNTYIGSVFSALLKSAAIKTDAPTANQETPKFYIVKPFTVRHNFDFETIDGFLGDTVIAVYGHPVYERPHAHSTVRDIVYAQDGTVLIADTALVHLRNEAQCAALLAYSLATTDQDISARLFSVQHFEAKKMSFNSRENGTNNAQYTGKFIWNLNEQVLRLGIRQMYLAGFDIHYAPFAWTVEQGKRIHGPAYQPNQHMPWFATYAFNYISQLYPDADYSKLKRGEQEYAQFLDELRKADPQAFEPSK